MDIVVTDEMRRAVFREACLMRGHDFEMVVDAAGAPVRVFCGRCDKSWLIASP